MTLQQERYMDITTIIIMMLSPKLSDRKTAKINAYYSYHSVAQFTVQSQLASKLEKLQPNLHDRHQQLSLVFRHLFLALTSRLHIIRFQMSTWLCKSISM